MSRNNQLKDIFSLKSGTTAIMVSPIDNLVRTGTVENNDAFTCDFNIIF